MEGDDEAFRGRKESHWWKFDIDDATAARTDAGTPPNMPMQRGCEYDCKGTRKGAGGTGRVVAKSPPRRPKTRFGRVTARRANAVTIPITSPPRAPLVASFCVHVQLKGPRSRPPWVTLQPFRTTSKRRARASPPTRRRAAKRATPKATIVEVGALDGPPRGKNKTKRVGLYRASAPGPVHGPCARPLAPCSLRCRLSSKQGALPLSPAPPPPPLANERPLGAHAHSRSTCSVDTPAPLPLLSRPRVCQACAYVWLSPCQSQKR